jgi:anti-sigma factor RsiW
MTERSRRFGFLRWRRRDRPAPLTCRELVTIVTDYLEGSLTPEDRARFEAHIAGCPGCTIYLEQMRQTIEALGHLPEESITPEAEGTLLAAFRSWSG